MNLSNTLEYALLTIIMFIAACLLCDKVQQVASELLNNAVNVPIK